MCYHIQALDVERCAKVDDAEIRVYMGIEPGSADSFQTYLAFTHKLKISKDYAIACTEDILKAYIHKEADGSLQERGDQFKKLAAAHLEHVVINLIGENESLTASTVVLDDYFTLLILMIAIPCAFGVIAIAGIAYFTVKLF